MLISDLKTHPNPLPSDTTSPAKHRPNFLGPKELLVPRNPHLCQTQAPPEPGLYPKDHRVGKRRVQRLAHLWILSPSVI